MATSDIATQNSKRTDYVQMSFKVPSDFKTRLEVLAELDNRSMTGELLSLIQPIMASRSQEIDSFLESLNPQSATKKYG